MQPTSSALCVLTHELEEVKTFAELGRIAVDAVNNTIRPSSIHVCPMYRGASPVLESVGCSDHHPSDFMRRRAFEEWPRFEGEIAPLVSLFGTRRGVVDFNAVFGSRILRTSTFHDYWRECRIQRQVVATFGTPAMPLGFLCIARCLNERPFTAADLDTLGAIRTLLLRALVLISNAHSTISLLIDVLSAVAVTLPELMGLLDLEGRVIWLSESAAEHLNVRTWHAGRAPVFGPRSSALDRWRDAIKQTADLPEGVHPVGSLTVHRVHTYGDVPLFLVLDGRGRSVMIGLNARKRLTGREQEIAEMVACGYTPSNVAVHLGIAVGTARNHLKSIYRKLGVSSRVELVIRMGRVQSGQSDRQ